jgi:hypothetical protein
MSLDHPHLMRRREWLFWGTAAVITWAASSRRSTLGSRALGLVGVADLHAGSVGRTNHPDKTAALLDARALLSPYVEGASLARWKIAKFLPMSGGTLSVILTDKHGAPFQLDLYARDTAADALRPPASSAAFDVFLANGGQGQTPSFEDHGLAAMSVAAVIRQNETHVSGAGLVTLRERIAVDRASVQRFV